MTPEKIGKYRVIQLLGRGGMGEVYLAEDPYIGRRVAIKMIKGAEPAARDRFLHEARVIGGLSHPAIVGLIDFDFSGDEPFLVMELLTGKGLDAWIRDGHSLREKLVVLDDLYQALTFAHEHGVLHRDVKPSNVQVLSSGRAKLMDFGIARGGSARLTATGAVMGTPEYMAPEILHDASYSPQSDVYAAAVLAYEMFTGGNPFAAKTVGATLTNVLTLDPPPLDSIVDGVPEALSSAVMACLRKDPGTRPSDFHAVLAAVRAALDAPAPPETRAIPLPPVTVPAPTTTSLAAPGRAVGGRRLAIGAAVVCAAIAASWLIWRPSPPDPATPAPAAETTPTAAPSPGEASAPAIPGSPEPAPSPSPPTRTPRTPAVTRSRETQGPQATPRPETPQSPAPAQSRLEPLAVPSATETPAIRTAVAEARPQPTSVSPVEATPGAQVGPPSFSQKLMEAPSVSSVSPRSIRRGSTAVLELRGERLRPDLGVRILQGRRPAVGIRVVRVEFVSPVLLRITVLSEAELPLGGYTLLLQDPTGASVPGVQIEVVL